MPEKKTVLHRRTVRTRPLTFTCLECGQEVTEEHWPGGPPKYCRTCRPVVRARQNRERQRRYQARKRGGGSR